MNVAKIALAVPLLFAVPGGCSDDDSGATSDPSAIPVRESNARNAVGTGSDGHDFRFDDGSGWRGDLGTLVTVEVVENGTTREFSGVLRAVRGEAPYRVLVVRDVGEESDDSRAFFEGDIVSMTGFTDADEVRATGSRNADGHLQTDKPGVFLLPWTGTVGVKARHDEIEMIAEEADQYGPGQIIVLEIDSPGGLVVEGDLIRETLVDVRKRHRVVAWIRKAISPGAFTALHCNEIYFTTTGTMGSAVMLAGQKAVPGPRLEAVGRDFGDVAEEVGRSRIPAECMADQARMASYDKDPETGHVTWHADMRGEFHLSDGAQMLVLDADSAMHSNYIDGIADTVEELAVHLDLSEWHEITDAGRRIHRRWSDLLDRCEEDVRRISRDLIIKPEDQRPALLERLLAWYPRVGERVMEVEFRLPPEDELRRQIERTGRSGAGAVERNRR